MSAHYLMSVPGHAGPSGQLGPGPDDRVTRAAGGTGLQGSRAGDQVCAGAGERGCRPFPVQTSPPGTRGRGLACWRTWWSGSCASEVCRVYNENNVMTNSDWLEICVFHTARSEISDLGNTKHFTVFLPRLSQLIMAQAPIIAWPALTMKREIQDWT